MMYDRYGFKKRGWPRCPECNEELACTSGLYRCCPNGHGKLEPYVSGTEAGIRRENTAAAVAFGKAVKAYDRAARKLADWRPTDRKAERDELTGPHTNPAPAPEPADAAA